MKRSSGAYAFRGSFAADAFYPREDAAEAVEDNISYMGTLLRYTKKLRFQAGAADIALQVIKNNYAKNAETYVQLVDKIL